MKKYLQITLVLAVFLAVVLFHHVYGGRGAAAQGNLTSSSNPPSPTVLASNPPETKAGNGPTPSPTATGVQGTTPTTSTPPTASSGQYKDGTYTGPPADAIYGTVQVQAIVTKGKLVNVKFLQYPNHTRTSFMINSQVMPWLTQEAVQAQSANVDIISGASATSYAFVQSLSSALSQAE